MRGPGLVSLANSFRFPPVNESKDSIKLFSAWLVALFLAVFSAKLWIVQLYGSPLPLWDQWFETAPLLKNWLTGLLTWKQLIAPYCEHRILFTRLVDLWGVWLNGRWEPLLQMVLNGFMHSAYVCGLAFCLWNFLGRNNGGLICFFLLPFFSLPYAAENTIWAFNSQAYFVGVFFLPTLAGLGFGWPGGRWWWLGWIAAILGLFTMASGLLAPATVAALVILRTLKSRRLERENLTTLAASLVVVAFGASLYVVFPGDVALRAHNFMEFAAALTRNLTWPFFDAPVMAVVLILPLLILFILYFQSRLESPRAAEFLLALALWSVLQSIALAYGRANFGEDIPASRYMDKLNVLVIASLFATVLLGQHWWRGEFSKKFALFLAVAFFAMVSFGLGRISQMVVEKLLMPTRMMTLVAEERVTTFLATGDERELLEKPTVRPDPKVTLGVLRDAQLQSILPASCLPSTATPVSGRFTASIQWLLRNSTMILYLGLGGMVFLCGYELARKPKGLVWENLPTFAAFLTLLAALGFVWTKEPIRRDTIERQLYQQLADYFKANHNSKRAAIYEHLAESPDQQ